jgi:hypothetical protein
MSPSMKLRVPLRLVSCREEEPLARTDRGSISRVPAACAREERDSGYYARSTPQRHQDLRRTT